MDGDTWRLREQIFQCEFPIRLQKTFRRRPRAYGFRQQGSASSPLKSTGIK